MKLSVIKNSLFPDSPHSSSPPHRPYFTPLGLNAALCAMLALPCVTQAIQIGNIETVSKLGEPLRVEVAISVAQNEPFDNNCISLVTPDTNAEDAKHYLTSSDVKLSISTDGKQPRILLSSHKSFNEVFTKFKLQVKCLGQGSMARTYTVLPDINDYAPSPDLGIPAAEFSVALAPQTASNNQSAIHAPPTSLVTTPVSKVIIDKPISQPINHSRQTKRVANSTRPARRTRAPGIFQLKISGNLLDTSRIGKISEEERALLLAQQRLLDSDDQMASILALQNQVKQLQNDIGDLRAKFAQLDGVPAHINQSSEITVNEAVAAEAETAPVKVTTVQSAVTPKPVSLPSTDWRTWVWQLGLLMMGIAGVAWWLSRCSNKKSASAPVQQFPEIGQVRPAQTAKSAPVTQFVSPGETTIKIKAMAQSAVAAKAASVKTIPSTENTPPLDGDEQSELDAIIEEAQLYTAFNHPLRAVKILQELLVEHPRKIEAWLLMLSIFSSLNRANEFENNARAFLRYNPKNYEAWKTIQVLGRTLNPDHPLYKDNTPALSPETVLGNRHLLGDVLIDLEMISPESLHHCLAHFDPKQHGRFGVYLVTEKVITHQQLTQALVHQSTLNQGVPYTPPVDLEFELPDEKWRD